MHALECCSAVRGVPVSLCVLDARGCSSGLFLLLVRSYASLYTNTAGCYRASPFTAACLHTDAAANVLPYLPCTTICCITTHCCRTTLCCPMQMRLGPLADVKDDEVRGRGGRTRMYELGCTGQVWAWRHMGANTASEVMHGAGPAPPPPQGPYHHSTASSPPAPAVYLLVSPPSRPLLLYAVPATARLQSHCRCRCRPSCRTDL